MSLEYTAISVTPPAQGIVRATVTTSEEIELPSEWRSKWIDVQADGADLWVRFAVADDAVATGIVTAARTTVSAGTEPAFALAANASMHIPAGGSRPFDLSQFKLEPSQPGQRVRLAHISLVTTGYIRIFPTSGKAVLA